MENIEIENKYLLTKEEFLKLIELLKLDKPIIQTNYYFDTKDFALRNKLNCSLRLRCYGNNKVKLTIKQKGQDKMLENSLYINKTIFDSFINKNITDKEVIDLLNKFNIDYKELEYKGSLETYRYKYPYQRGMLFLDNSKYRNMEDYELEYESDSLEYGKKVIEKLLKENNIPIKVNTRSKFARALNL